MERTEKATLQVKLHDILPLIKDVFNNEPAVFKINKSPIMIIADIHGDLDTLNYILNRREELKCKNMLFLGDYVDRGLNSVAVLYKLFELKLAEPDNIFLLRGNHEDSVMNRHYGFFEEINKNEILLDLIDGVYIEMPVAAVLNNEIFCVHGGLKGIESVDSITKANAFQYLWNDPKKKPGLGLSNRGRGIRTFGPDIVEGFLNMNNLSVVIRGHTCNDTGCNVIFDGMLISLFSVPNYCDLDNIGAFLYINDNILTIKHIR